MSIYLNANISALNSVNNLNMATRKLNKSLERLSSGYKINRASDGPSSLLVSENLRSQIRGTDVAMSNVQQGLSMVQSADGAMQQITEHLQHMREIALAASNGTVTADQMAAYAADYAASRNTIDNIAANVKYGTTALLDGSTGTINIQIGANSGDTFDVSGAFTTCTAAALGAATAALATAADAATLLGQVDAALAAVSTKLATVGTFENSLSDQLTYLGVAKENYTSAEANIRNTDVATETANVTRLQILQQAAAYSLSQANAMPSLALRLLQ